MKKELTEKEQKKHKKTSKIILIILIVIIFGIVKTCLSSDNSKNNLESEENKENVITDNIEIPNYLIFDKKDISFATTTRFIYAVEIKEIVTEEQLDKIANEVLEKAKKDQDFNAISINFYDHKEFSQCRLGYTQYSLNGKWEDADKSKKGEYKNFSFEKHYTIPKDWSNILTDKEAKIIAFHNKTSSQLIDKAETSEEMQNAPIEAINKTSEEFKITQDEVNSLLTKFFAFN